MLGAEDFHKTDDDDKVRVSQVMKVFMDMADEYRELKIIALARSTLRAKSCNTIRRCGIAWQKFTYL